MTQPMYQRSARPIGEILSGRSDASGYVTESSDLQYTTVGLGGDVRFVEDFQKGEFLSRKIQAMSQNIRVWRKGFTKSSEDRLKDFRLAAACQRASLKFSNSCRTNVTELARYKRNREEVERAKRDEKRQAEEQERERVRLQEQMKREKEMAQQIQPVEEGSEADSDASDLSGSRSDSGSYTGSGSSYTGSSTGSGSTTGSGSDSESASGGENELDEEKLLAELSGPEEMKMEKLEAIKIKKGTRFDADCLLSPGKKKRKKSRHSSRKSSRRGSASSKSSRRSRSSRSSRKSRKSSRGSKGELLKIKRNRETNKLVKKLRKRLAEPDVTPDRLSQAEEVLRQLHTELQRLENVPDAADALADIKTDIAWLTETRGFVEEFILIRYALTKEEQTILEPLYRAFKDVTQAYPPLPIIDRDFYDSQATFKLDGYSIDLTGEELSVNHGRMGPVTQMKISREDGEKFVLYGLEWSKDLEPSVPQSNMRAIQDLLNYASYSLGPPGYKRKDINRLGRVITINFPKPVYVQKLEMSFRLQDVYPFRRAELVQSAKMKITRTMTSSHWLASASLSPWDQTMRESQSQGPYPGPRHAALVASRGGTVSTSLRSQLVQAVDTFSKDVDDIDLELRFGEAQIHNIVDPDLFAGESNWVPASVGINRQGLTHGASFNSPINGIVRNSNYRLYDLVGQVFAGVYPLVQDIVATAHRGDASVQDSSYITNMSRAELQVSVRITDLILQAGESYVEAPGHDHPPSNVLAAVKYYFDVSHDLSSPELEICRLVDTSQGQEAKKVNKKLETGMAVGINTFRCSYRLASLQNTGEEVAHLKCLSFYVVDPSDSLPSSSRVPVNERFHAREQLSNYFLKRRMKFPSAPIEIIADFLTGSLGQCKRDRRRFRIRCESSKPVADLRIHDIGASLVTIDVKEESAVKAQSRERQLV